MITKSRIGKTVGSLLLVGGIVFAGGIFNEAAAQGRDPFVKPTVKLVPKAKPKADIAKNVKPKTDGPLGAPPVEQRVQYYMNVIRPQCIQQGCAEMPKPTVVMTLSEMTVTGISRTPRGYAAIVELTPIKLSYTIYPGEKFFDGQLVAVEDNQLVFRKVTKMGSGKFTVAEEKKTLRKMNFQEELARSAATAEALPASGATETEKEAQGLPVDIAARKPAEVPMTPGKIEFPMDEMVKSEKDAPKEAKEKPAKGKKPVAKKKN